MKATWLLFVVIGSAGVMHGQASGTRSTRSSPQPSASHSNARSNAVGHVEQAAAADGAQQADRKDLDGQWSGIDVSNNKGPRGNSHPTKANGPKQLPTKADRSIFGAPLNRRADLTNSRYSGHSRTVGPIQNQVTNRTSSLPLTNIARSNPIWINNVRHRSPNPAIVGTIGNANNKAARGLNGSRMGRKP
jgi:hypothetical protein